MYVISSRSHPERPSSVSLTRASTTFYGIAATGSYFRFNSLRDAPPEGAVRKVCRCEPVTDVTGVAAPRLNGNRLVLLPRCLKIRGIATPACALVRNDGAFSNSPVGEGGSFLALSLGFAPPLCYYKAIHLRKGKCTVEKLSQQMMQSVCVGVLAPLVVVGAMGKLPQRPPAFSGQDSSVTVHLTDRDDMALDAYLQRVLLGEMPPTFEPEALKAQAVAARTYTVKHREKHGGKLCTDSTCCQAFCGDGVFAAFSEEDRERAAAAVRETDGLVLTYEGALIDATFFSCSGGRTEDALAVWGTDVP